MASFHCVYTGVLCFVASIALVNCSAFRGGADPHAVEKAHRKAEAIRAAMLDEVTSALGTGNRVTQERLARIEEAARPIYLSMQKNSAGNLDHIAVRYVLHRLFVLRHAMYIKGLEPQGGAWNASTSSEILEDFVPSYVQSLFEARLQGQGLDLHEIAILAATLEHIIHDEAAERLRLAYSIMGSKETDHVPEFEAHNIIDAYTVLFIQGTASSSPTRDEMLQEMAALDNAFPNWKAAQQFTRNIMENTILQNRHDSDFKGGALTFHGMLVVVEEFGERFGRWQDADCQDLKGALVSLDKTGTGRVSLRDFHRKGSHGIWEFAESPEYLRALGALDESTPTPSLIIPNYVNARSNCLATSSIYAVCCVNECEELLSSVEADIQAPAASPERILEVVGKLPSATVQAPRVIPELLRKRLDEVAGLYEGQVRIHGRLFAQWMHHAYPKECPFPHKAGTTTPLSQEEWLEMEEETAQQGDTLAANLNFSGPSAGAVEPTSMWSLEEELPMKWDPPVSHGSQGSSIMAFIRNVAFLSAAVAFCMSMRKLVSNSGSSVGTELPIFGTNKAKHV